MHVDVPVRPKPAVEAIACFVVAEALANVAKHSRAPCAKVWVEGHGYPGTLTVMVSDDGVGGANANGAGLTGLADRVRGLNGRFSVESRRRAARRSSRRGTAMRATLAQDSVLLCQGLVLLLTRAGAAAFESAGDEPIFIRATASPGQLELLAGAVL